MKERRGGRVVYIRKDGTYKGQTDKISFVEFTKLSDTGKAEIVKASQNVELPRYLDNSELQKFVYYTNMNSKPQIVDDYELDKIPAQDYFRGVSDGYYDDVTITAAEIYEQICYGNFTKYSDSGGSKYGKGIYFTQGYREAASYTTGDTGMVMRAKIDPRVTVKRSKLIDMMCSDNSEFGKTCAMYEHGLSIYALAKGYKAIDTGFGYVAVLDRSAIWMSNQLHSAQEEWWRS